VGLLPVVTAARCCTVLMSQDNTRQTLSLIKTTFYLFSEVVLKRRRIEIWNDKFMTIRVSRTIHDGNYDYVNDCNGKNDDGVVRNGTVAEKLIMAMM
jgi:hypothetical protein